MPSKIEDFKGLHRGKKLFIMASGPSLADLDLNLLKNKITMGLNRSVLVYPDVHYLCAMDDRLFDLHEEEFKKARYLFTLENRPFGIPMKLLGAEGFSHDLANGVYSGYTISYVALQLAVYMGFKQIFYLGLDLCHKGINTHFFGACHHSKNHETTEFPKMLRMFEYGAKILQSSDVAVYNCSPVSTLKCFQKVDFQWALNQ